MMVPEEIGKYKVTIVVGLNHEKMRIDKGYYEVRECAEEHKEELVRNGFTSAKVEKY